MRRGSQRARRAGVGGAAFSRGGGPARGRAGAVAEASSAAAFPRRCLAEGVAPFPRERSRLGAPMCRGALVPHAALPALCERASSAPLGSQQLCRAEACSWRLIPFGGRRRRSVLDCKQRNTNPVRPARCAEILRVFWGLVEM